MYSNSLYSKDGPEDVALFSVSVDLRVAMQSMVIDWQEEAINYSDLVWQNRSYSFSKFHQFLLQVEVNNFICQIGILIAKFDNLSTRKFLEVFQS